jgi:hypothetical protein
MSFGGGGNGADNTNQGGVGGQGAVRIVWPGNTRSFPSTDVWMSDIITTVIETQSSTSGSITIPASAQAGDLAVLINYNETIGAQSNPSGWTRIVNQEASVPVLTGWYRIIESGDAGTSVTVTGGSSPSSEMILLRKASGAISSVVASGGAIQRTTGTPPTTQVQSASTANIPFVVFGAFGATITATATSDMYFTGGAAGSGNIEPSYVYSGGNGDTSRQAFMRFRIYDEAPSTDVSVVCRRNISQQTMASFIIRIDYSVGGLLVNTNTTVNRINTYNTNFDSDANYYYDWTVPVGVTEISAVVVGAGGGGSGSDGGSGGAGGGGGALSYANSVSVTPGETLRIYAGRGGFRPSNSSYGPAGFPSGIVRLSDSSVLLKAIGGSGASSTGAPPGQGGQAADGVGDVKYSGSTGGLQGGNTGGGGGGAAGYSADGSTGLGGSGYFGGNGDTNGLGGGGVGIFGEGASGTTAGQGGSGGGNGIGGSNGGAGGAYGGGGGGGADEVGSTEYYGGSGKSGAVRIIWGTQQRAFPSTLTSFADSEGLETTITL